LLPIENIVIDRVCQVLLDCKYDEEPVLALRSLSAHSKKLSCPDNHSKVCSEKTWWCKKRRIGQQLR
jgi:hypothetical protein